MTCFVNDGVSIGVLLQIVSIFQTRVDSGWGSCFSSLTASSLHVWYLRVCFLIQFSNHLHVRTLSTLTCFSGNSSLIYLFFTSEKAMWVYCQGDYMVIHLSGMHPLENLCSSRLICVFSFGPLSQTRISTWQLKAVPLFFFFFHELSSHNSLKPYLMDAANAAIYSNNTNQHVLFLISD